MKKFDAKFIKYSVVLFIVSVALISVAAISLTRNSERADIQNTSASSRIEALGNENVSLKQQIQKKKDEIETLKKENENLLQSADKYIAMNSVFEAEVMIEQGDYKNALICLEKIDEKLLEGTFASHKREKLLEMIKEKTENDWY